MKISILSIATAFIVAIFLPSVSLADSGNGSITTNLNKIPTPDPPITEIPDNGKRIPGLPVICYISITGGIQSEIPTEEIISYDLYDSRDNMLASFSDDMDFAQYLFSLNPGEYKICIVTEEWLYVGYLSTF